MPEDQILFYGETFDNLEGQPPTKQLEVLLSGLPSLYTNETPTLITSGSALAILNHMGIVREGYQAEIFAIMKAYEGDPLYAPKDGRPLPDIEEVLIALKNGKMEIVDRESRRKKNIYEQATGTMPTTFVFRVPHDENLVPEESKFYLYNEALAGLWPARFRELNNLPSLEEAEQKRLEQERVERYGVLGKILNRVRPFSVDASTIDTGLRLPYSKEQRLTTGKNGVNALTS